MTRPLAFALFLCSLSASSQCSQPTLVVDWSEPGKAIKAGTTLGAYFGVQVGDSLRMDTPMNLATGKPAKRSIRLYRCEGGVRYHKPWRVDWDALPNDQSTNHQQ